MDEEGFGKPPSCFNHNVVNLDTRPCGKGVLYCTAGSTAFWRRSESKRGGDGWGLRRKSINVCMCGSRAFLFRFTMLYSETPDMSECVPLDQGTQVTLDTNSVMCKKRCVCVCVCVFVCVCVCVCLFVCVCCLFHMQGTRGYSGGSRQDNPPLLSDGPPQQQHNLETTKLRSPPVPSMMDRSSPQAGGAMPLYPNNMSQPPLPRVARQHHQMQQQGPRPMDHQMPQQGPRPMDHQMPQQGPRPMDHQMHQQGPRPMDHQMPQQGPRPMDHQLPQQGPRPMDHQMHHQGPRPMDHQMHQQVPRPMDHQRFMLTTPRVDIRYQPYPPRAGGGGGGRPVALGNQLDGWI